MINSPILIKKIIKLYILCRYDRLGPNIITFLRTYLLFIFSFFFLIFVYLLFFFSYLIFFIFIIFYFKYFIFSIFYLLSFLLNLYLICYLYASFILNFLSLACKLDLHLLLLGHLVHLPTS